jgi:hypothetical protein
MGQPPFLAEWLFDRGGVPSGACRKLRLQYQVEDYFGEVHSVDDTIYLQRFPQPFGGYRWYFICPSSNRRCTVLYQPPGAIRFRSRWGFRCRLQYQS